MSDGLKPIASVFPSQDVTVYENELFDPGYTYQMNEMIGFDPENDQAIYSHLQQAISFVQKHEDGTWTPGLQSEQLLIALIDRHKKLNAKFPSREGALAITKMEEALMWMEARVKERTNRGVMGKLEK